MYRAVLAALALGAVGVLLTYGAVWAVVQAPVFGGADSPTTPIDLTGRDLAPLGSAAGWVALAGLAGILATRGIGRRIVGGIVAIAGGAAATTALTVGLSGADAVILAVRARTGVAPSAEAIALTPWWLPAMLAGLVVLIAGGLTLVRGPRWSTLSSRYERGGAASGQARGEGSDAAATWDALDRGEDPTT